MLIIKTFLKSRINLLFPKFTGLTYSTFEILKINSIELLSSLIGVVQFLTENYCCQYLTSSSWKCSVIQRSQETFSTSLGLSKRCFFCIHLFLSIYMHQLFLLPCKKSYKYKKKKKRIILYDLQWFFSLIFSLIFPP
jgi:hypothetical protein